MSKNYIVPEKDLVRFLTAYHKLTALEGCGVDNWSGYGESFMEYISDGLNASAESVINEDLDFEDIAKRDLRNYMPL